MEEVELHAVLPLWRQIDINGKQVQPDTYTVAGYPSLKPSRKPTMKLPMNGNKDIKPTSQEKA